MSPEQQARSVYDAATGVAAVSSPLWLQHLENGSAAFVAIGGALLVLIRLGLAIKEWRQKGRGE